jgi:isopentenyl-diphosphate Delta-isomerase
MKEEIYDVVDEQGNVLGQASWSEVHSKGLLHQTAAVMLFRDEKREEFLVQRRSEQVILPGLLQHSAGGHVISGKTPDEGALLELKEELFHEVDLPGIPLKKVVHFLQRDMPANLELLHIYEGYYDGDFSPNPEELAGRPYWVDWEELLGDVGMRPERYTPSFRLVLEQYIRHREL